MNTIIVKTQAELDALPDSFSEFTVIQIQSDKDAVIYIRKDRDSSHVVARGSSHVEAWGSSHVVAWDSSHVVAWGSSHVEARDSSHVEAWGSSHVVAWDSSHVVAWGSSAVHNHSCYTTLEIGGFVVAWLLAKAKKVTKVSKTAQTITPEREKGLPGWLDAEGVKATRGKVVIYKRVSPDWKTQEGTPNETLWAVGTTVEHPSWDPKRAECGEGKFHACSRPYFCDEFRSGPGEHYVAIEVATKDMHAWDGAQYPHKVAFRKGTILHEVNKFGQKIEAGKGASV